MKSNIKQIRHYTGIGIKFGAVYALIWSCGWPPAVLLFLWQSGKWLCCSGACVCLLYLEQLEKAADCLI